MVAQNHRRWSPVMLAFVDHQTIIFSSCGERVLVTAMRTLTCVLYSDTYNLRRDFVTK